MEKNGNYPERVFKKVENGRIVFYFVDPKTKEPISDQTFLHAADFINGFAAVDGGGGVGWHHILPSLKKAYCQKEGVQFTGVGDFTPNVKGVLEAGVIQGDVKFKINIDGRAIPGTARKWPT